MSRCVLVVAIGLWMLPPAGAAPTYSVLQANGCPDDTEQGHRIVLRFVSSAEYADSRARHQVPTAPVEQVRILTDAADGEACKRLHALVHQRTDASTVRYLPTFFAAGGYYYVPLVKEPKPHPRGYMDTSMVPLLVVDRSFHIVASVGM